MFIDYVALLLVNMVAAYFILAGYVYKGIDDPDQRKWAVGFGMTGVIALVFGAVMCFTWPLPGPYNSAYGEMSVLLGTILLATAFALANGWNLMIIAVYAFFAGAAAVVLVVAGLIWAATAYPAYFMHMKAFAKWLPVTMRR